MSSEPADPHRSAAESPATESATESATDLRAAAIKVLQANDRGAVTVAAPQLYPHQWSWDAGFVCVGLARLSVSRACVELDSLLSGQWRTGMIPHIVFSEDPEGWYFPGADWWRTGELSANAPRKPLTSGICQPPVHAIALDRILRLARRGGGTDQRVAEEFARRAWPALYAWHNWLITTRRDPHSGLIAIVHGWESGTDNSPRWDQPYAAVPTGPVPPYQRRDIRAVADPSQRPTDEEYNRYLFLVEELKSAGYDDAAVARQGSFRVGDVLFTAILAVACEVLAGMADGLSPGSDPQQVAELRQWAGELRSSVAGSLDPARGLARDYDVRAGQWLANDTIAGFAPLLCGGLADSAERDMLATFDGLDWCGHPDLVVPVPPSTSLRSPGLDLRCYWRGPLWPVMTWLYGWALARRGHRDRAAALRAAGLRLVSDGRFAEYYEPMTGEALGSADQSWTAAVTLDWLDQGGLG
ncbi:MAG TPA: hypothetical protein VHJ83_17320 [Micromonosporaceae bacterium]|jgi:hypothetical protein|nr:hypothetical protein [Micromonosporaceae bacterium]